MTTRKILEPLTFSRMIEAPYFLAQNRIALIPLVGRNNDWVTGYKIYMSLEGESYFELTNSSTFQHVGRLDADYEMTNKIDRGDGFSVTFLCGKPDLIETITEQWNMTGFNLALLGGELISFKTVTPITTSQYQFTDVIRGRLDTQNIAHGKGETFWFLGRTGYDMIQDAEFVHGAIRYFKFIPMGLNGVGNISNCPAYRHTITSRALTPYPVTNLRVNGARTQAQYTTDLAISWTPRTRGDGSGVGVIDQMISKEVAWEGSFKIEVYVSDTKIATYTDLSGSEWLYKAAWLTSDNGGELPLALTLKISGFIVDRSYTYESEQVEITVKKV